MTRDGQGSGESYPSTSLSKTTAGPSPGSIPIRTESRVTINGMSFCDNPCESLHVRDTKTSRYAPDVDLSRHQTPVQTPCHQYPQQPRPPPRSSSGQDLPFTPSLPPTLTALTNKQFKLMRLKRDPGTPLGVYITSKRHPEKGTHGYVIAYIEPNGLTDR